MADAALSIGWIEFMALMVARSIFANRHFR